MNGLSLALKDFSVAASPTTHSLDFGDSKFKINLEK